MARGDAVSAEGVNLSGVEQRTVHGAASTDEVGAIVRHAVVRGRGLRVRGAGTWTPSLRWAGEESLEVLDVSALGGVLEYTPGDLTISIGAGMTIAELDEVTRAEGQWCPLAPWGADDGTVGATIATATAGPFAQTFGRPRDLAIGLECVDGSGRIIRAGGRVVKNVAGFDLTRLMTGQWGTLGVITAVNLRLRALPVVDESWMLTTTPGRDEDVRTFARGPYAPIGCLCLGNDRWLLRVGGNRSFVDASLERARLLGACEPADDAAWRAARKELSPPVRTAGWKWDELSLRLKASFDPHGVLNPRLLESA